MDTLLLMIGIFVGIVFGLFGLVRVILNKLHHTVSPYLLFGGVVIVCALPVVGFAMYDILTPGGDLNGMLGQLLLMIVVPTVVVLLIGDGVFWAKRRKNSKEQDQSLPNSRL